QWSRAFRARRSHSVRSRGGCVATDGRGSPLRSGKWRIIGPPYCCQRPLFVSIASLRYPDSSAFAGDKKKQILFHDDGPRGSGMVSPFPRSALFYVAQFIFPAFRSTLGPHFALILTPTKVAEVGFPKLHVTLTPSPYGVPFSIETKKAPPVVSMRPYPPDSLGS